MAFNFSPGQSPLSATHLLLETVKVAAKNLNYYGGIRRLSRRPLELRQQKMVTFWRFVSQLFLQGSLDSADDKELAVTPPRRGVSNVMW
jgi:hypothetical protein